MAAELNDPRIPAKFWANITVTEGGCWRWDGPKLHKRGYSRLSVNNRRVLGHRYFYEMFKGSIPDGLVIDHTCHNADLACDKKGECPHRACVNPEHLEAITSVANVLRSTQTWGNQNTAKEFCPSGHPYDVVNTRVHATKSGIGRQCRKCQAEWASRKAAKDREAHLQRGREYYAENRERLLAAKRAYDAEKKDSKKAYDSARRGSSTS
jgi:hypothetical protein